jgi:branched-chain amino acid transport system substrate-binding protein
VFSPGSAYHWGTLDMIADAVTAAGGIPSDLTIAYLYEDDSFSRSVADAAKQHAVELGFQAVYEDYYPAGETDVDPSFQARVSALVAATPDVVLGGGHQVDGESLARAIDALGYRPSTMSILVAPAAGTFYQSVTPCDGCVYADHPAESVTGPSQWETGVQFNQADTEAAGERWFGPSIEEFTALYDSVTVDMTPSYHAVGAANGALALALGVEGAGSVDSELVRAELIDLEFVSVFGAWDIDDAGLQLGHAMVEVQWQDGVKEIVWPVAARTAPFVYPMVTP